MEALCFYLIVQNNQKQRDIYINSSNLVSGKLYEKINKVKRLFQMDELMDELMEENIQLKEQLAQNKYLRGSDPQVINDSVSLQHYQYIHAKIIDKTLNLRNNIFTINKGYDDGIQKGMGVLEENGILGIVNKVGKYYSSIIPLLNSRTSISVVLKESGALGSLIWEGNHPKKMFIEGVPKHIQVTDGQTVITSGFSLFPRGVEVGTVTGSNLEAGSNFYKIEILLKNDPGTAYNVLVVKNILPVPKHLESTSNLYE